MPTSARGEVGVRTAIERPSTGRCAKATAGRLFGFLRIAVGLGLLCYLLTKVDLASAWAVMRLAQPGWLIVATLSFLGFLVISNWRWKILLDARSLRFSFGYLLRVYLISWMFNNILPTSIGGDVARIAYTARGGRKAIAFAATLVDRIVGFVGLFFFALVMSVVLWFVTHTHWYLALNLFGFLGLVAITLILFSDRAYRVAARVCQRIRIFRLGERIDTIYCAVKEYRSARVALVWSFLTSLLLQFTLALTWYTTARSVDGRALLLYFCLLIPIIGVITMVPISIGGLGVRENSFRVFFTAERMSNHLTQEQAIATALLYLVITILFALVGAVVFLLTRRTSLDAPSQGSGLLSRSSAPIKTT
ncbi:MAG: lysylphosphatidylglycerol synthase transmembrane domain-containing protein [candidate division WOR-3 bacterium]